MKKILLVSLIGIGAIAIIVVIILTIKARKQQALSIVQAPNAILRSISDPVDDFDEDVRGITKELQDTAKKLDSRFNVFSLGLAAPQLGYNKRIVVLKKTYGNYTVMLNPEILEQSWTVPWLSTCFSLKSLHILPRPLRMKIRYQDLQGGVQEEILWGVRSSVMQQEIDHLNGILVSDYWL